MKKNDTNTVLTQIGANIKAYRKQKGLDWTQEKLAEKASINSKHLSDIELGKFNVSIGYLCKIADALGISYRQLIE